MKTKLTLIILSVLMSASLLAVSVETVNQYKNQNVDVGVDTDVHITNAANALVNSTVNLKTTSSWLFFDNIRPADVLNTYKGSILIDGQALNSGENARVNVYRHGTVIIPHTSDYQPLEVYTGKDLTGESNKYDLHTYYNKLENFDNKIKSFRLKRGYMATFATISDGTGYSKVYIAENEDLVINELPKELDATISFIRTFVWQWSTKKGWCGSSSNCFEEGDLTQSTWIYTWSADRESSANLEWVPMRHNAGWPGWDQIREVKNSSHLLGFNEPDRSDQALMTVEEAIEQWPELLKTGLRLGSPAPSAPQNGNNWLYRFIDKCDSLNYRVDFVAVHCYWDNKSPKNWYNDLKYVYERTGRPLWITEWNNGANWTSEWWPSDWNEQQQKQLKDLKGILQVLDTASFIERYSLYNWVEDKRMIVKDGALTPAGEYYSKNKSQSFFDRSKEVNPHWNIVAANLGLEVDDNGTPILSWDDKNEGLTGKYQLFRTENDATEEMIKELDSENKQFADAYSPLDANKVSYTLKLFPAVGSEEVASNTVKYFISEANKELQFGKTIADDNTWYYHKLRTKYEKTPTILFGTPSNLSGMPLSIKVKSLNASGFQFHFDPWSYLEDKNLYKNEDIAFATLPEGYYDLGGVKLETGTVKSVSASWKQVKFARVFDEIPVVFATQITDRAKYPTAIAIRNVTKEGFEVAQQKESIQNDITVITPNTNICYWAATPGTATLSGQKINVGRTPENSVGGLHAGKQITFEQMTNPLVFCSMQTANDKITSTLKYNNLTSESVNIFKQREFSKESGNPNSATKETVGWLVLEGRNTEMSIAEETSNAKYSIYPNPAKDVFHINNLHSEMLDVVIFDLAGKKILEQVTEGEVDIRNLTSGYYIVQINGSAKLKLIKK